MYNLYGFRLQTDLRLACPLFETPVSRPDIELVEYSASDLQRACESGGTPLETSDFYEFSRLHDGSIHLRWPGLFEFLVSANGERIGWRNLGGTRGESLQEYLLGQVLSFAMLVRGVEPLHATAVVVEKGAVAFLGDSGYGKSTLGASFMRKNYLLLTDDVLVLEQRGRGFVAHPGMPRIKLLPQMCSNLFRGRKGVPMNRFTDKTIFALTAQEHHLSPIPLRALYVLSDPRNRSSRVIIRRTSERRAFLSVLKNTFNDILLDPTRLKRQFEFASNLAAHVSVKALSYPRTLTGLPAVVEAVLSDLAQEGRNA